MFNREKPLTKKAFKKKFTALVQKLYERPLKSCTQREKYEALVFMISRKASQIRNRQLANNPNDKIVYYFSMEFLIGKLLDNYLINLGWRNQVAEGLEELGENLEELCDFEPEPGLGNGGLGRLAACFLDSMAATGIKGNGMGLRYRFGLFKQQIYNGYQNELPDAWLDDGYPWEHAETSDSVIVKFGGKVDRSFKNGQVSFECSNCNCIKAVPYDVPVVGAGGKTVNILHLWDAEPVKDNIDMDAFNRGDYTMAMKERNDIEAITSILYPDDSNGTARKLRLRQEYFLVAAGLGLITREYKAKHEDEWRKFPERISIHINDTHPTLCIPELMRILIDEEGLKWDEAWDITVNAISYTNHTVLPEALEKWEISMFKELLPRIYMIIEEINRRWQDSIPQANDNWRDIVAATSVLWDNSIRMANMSIIGSHSVNGVSTLHSEILKKMTFKDFYKLSPNLFNNKTNGISHRRFLIQSNPDLTDLITEAIGSRWKSNINRLGRLRKFADDTAFLEKLAEVKKTNKLRLADYISRNLHIAVDPDSIFDVHVKRIHAYKRQLLNAFKILDLYNRLKENPNIHIHNYTFIFAGKAAQGYTFAKEIIKFINSLADLINSDPAVNDKIKIVFIENFCVSNAQLIYPAADISEQISTAGKEASGTGNMKFMMNGAVTLGTLDGANLEINELVGHENIEIFGLTAKEIADYYENGGYSAADITTKNPRIKQITEQLISGFFSKCGCDFWSIYDALLQHNDEFFVLGDFDAYVKAWENLDKLYSDSKKWNRMSLMNILNSAYFSSDRTIREYTENIWHA